jgi:flagellar motor switch/type III secretory pathway protein FliN
MSEQADNTATQRPPDAWSDLMALDCVLTIDLPVPGFTVRDLLRLDRGSIVETRWKEATHLPLLANGRRVGWVEFEVTGEKFAVQVTELA